MGDVVNLGANCYFAIAANANAMPPSDKWDLLAAGGGILKLPGIPFPAGEISSHETKTISVMLRGAEIGQVITASCRSPLPPGLTSQAFISSHEIVSLSLTNWLPHPVTLESALIWDFSVT
jgi:hypothetical protein